MVQVTKRGRSRTAFPPGGGAVKAVTKAEHQHHVQRLCGQAWQGVFKGDVPPSEA